ncbi:MAG: hypothetical protein QMD92_02125 [bacterium]|nr:hypothetical protein [bacterium]
MHKDLGNYKKAPYKRPECWEYARIKANKRRKKKLDQPVEPEPEVKAPTQEELKDQRRFEIKFMVGSIILFIVFLKTCMAIIE